MFSLKVTEQHQRVIRLHSTSQCHHSTQVALVPACQTKGSVVDSHSSLCKASSFSQSAKLGKHWANETSIFKCTWCLGMDPKVVQMNVPSDSLLCKQVFRAETSQAVCPGPNNSSQMPPFRSSDQIKSTLWSDWFLNSQIHPSGLTRHSQSPSDSGKERFSATSLETFLTLIWLMQKGLILMSVLFCALGLADMHFNFILFQLSRQTFKLKVNWVVLFCCKRNWNVVNCTY